MADKIYNIAVIGGDGTGPEVVREGKKVLDAVCSRFGFNLNYIEYDFGGERYLKTGEAFASSAIDDLKKTDAIYLGAIGHPDVRPGILERGILLKIRFELDQYINIRPVKLYDERFTPLKDKTPKDIDFIVVRENTEGLYTGMGGVQYKGTQQEVSTQVHCTTRFGAERAIRYAFEVCKARHLKKMWQGLSDDEKKQGFKGKVHLVAKTNVLTFVHDTWWRAFNEVGEKNYPDIKTDYAHVDATAMWLVKNPEWFDVIVTENMFGDIITDLGAMIQGGMGIAAGGNINPKGISMFEPIGGSAPKYTGKNIINPLAAICAAGMMLENLGEIQSAQAIENSVIKVVREKLKSLAAGKMGYSTTEVGDMIAKFI
ncbi:3-isopropylmalate dehydrogenase [bacterium Unc6]|nr:3-isopropylmalate dehydrogenase [bacterium Unc6]